LDRFIHKSIPERIQALSTAGYKIVIFSNQAGITRGQSSVRDLRVKIQSIIGSLGVPVQAYVAMQHDQYRKPETAMWDLMVHHGNGPPPYLIDMQRSFYVGDAAGRPGDFSSSDAAFARTLKLTFYTPEEFFLRKEIPGVYLPGSHPPPPTTTTTAAAIAAPITGSAGGSGTVPSSVQSATTAASSKVGPMDKYVITKRPVVDRPTSITTGGGGSGSSGQHHGGIFVPSTASAGRHNDNDDDEAARYRRQMDNEEQQPEPLDVHAHRPRKAPPANQNDRSTRTAANTTSSSSSSSRRPPSPVVTTGVAPPAPAPLTSKRTESNATQPMDIRAVPSLGDDTSATGKRRSRSPTMATSSSTNNSNRSNKTSGGGARPDVIIVHSGDNAVERSPSIMGTPSPLTSAAVSAVFIPESLGKESQVLGGATSPMSGGGGGGRSTSSSSTSSALRPGAPAATNRGGSSGSRSASPNPDGRAPSPLLHNPSQPPSFPSAMDAPAVAAGQLASLPVADGLEMPEPTKHQEMVIFVGSPASGMFL
jgi:DNA 3'-phosphatase